MSIRHYLLALPFVAAKRLSAREGYFTAGRMFALLSEGTILLRLPDPSRADGADAEVAPTLIGAPVPAGLGWVSVTVDETAPDELERLVAAAHDAVRRASRRLPRSRTRRRRPRVTA